MRLAQIMMILVLGLASASAMAGGDPVIGKTKATPCVACHGEDGRGIAPNHVPRLFERFYRVDKARSRNLGGTGLGLAIVKHIAQAHGGSVRVESNVGSGATFTLRIPAA